MSRVCHSFRGSQKMCLLNQVLTVLLVLTWTSDHSKGLPARHSKMQILLQTQCWGRKDVRIMAWQTAGQRLFNKICPVRKFWSGRVASRNRYEIVNYSGNTQHDRWWLPTSGIKSRCTTLVWNLMTQRHRCCRACFPLAALVETILVLLRAFAAVGLSFLCTWSR